MYVISGSHSASSWNSAKGPRLQLACHLEYSEQQIRRFPGCRVHPRLDGRPPFIRSRTTLSHHHRDAH
ncbi:hypothetical protein PsYK624_074680 [Phanerochaete sordida]|uniref:Uncharacterized protein n=1 Tax=Phanerochaete sordida TaxID=48140 RepID=A0A9P3GBH5_9APHY|nr:hypothetical protein PsYK624_074680 [Phanerochaete sordida]